MRVAIVHDWFTLAGGAERCIAEMLKLYPDADLFSVVDFLPEADRGFLGGRVPRTSFIQRLPFARRRYRGYLPLMPLAVEQFDLSGYDLVLSSTSSVAKGVITGPDQLHVAYVHSPMRYAWDLQHAYLREAGLERGMRAGLARLILHYMRMWDVRTAPGVDRFVANSSFIARRIAKTYGREAAIVHPPVDVDRFTPADARGDHYVTASRMVPYKRIPLIAEAFAGMPGRRLTIVGDGPEMPRVRALAAPNIEITGRLSDAEVAAHLSRARAFVFAAEEDFGIVPVEAQACGTPVIAYARGGARETIRGEDGPGQTGVFFDRQTPEAIREAVERFEARADAIDPAACRANAARFAPDRFREALAAVIDEAWAERRSAR